MLLNDIYISALKELKGFDKDAIDIAISLAKNDVVETVEEFIDFVNFNIEEKHFPQITQPFDVHVIRQAIEKVRDNNGKITHFINVTDSGYPQKLLQSQIGTLSPLSYKGNLKVIERKTIMITGSSSITNNAKLASKYLGKIFATYGYNILNSFSEGCEQSSILGCSEVSGYSTFFLPHSIEYLSTKEKEYIERELETGRSSLISVSNSPKADENTIEESYLYLLAICDCVVVPQLSLNDMVKKFIRKCLAVNKPVYFVKYKTGGGDEYHRVNLFRSLGIRYLSSDTALEQIKETIGEPNNSLNSI